MTAALVLPLELEWRLTDACNLRCAYCPVEKPEEVSAPRREVLDRIVALSPRYVWLGGGEPTLLEGFPPLVKTLKERTGAHLGLSTNLTRPSAVKEVLPYIDDLIVSLDTLDPALSRRYRGVDPRELLRSLGELVREIRGRGYPVLVSVNSVVAAEMLASDGVRALNDALGEMDQEIRHLLTPVYPQGAPGSIIGDAGGTAAFFALAGTLRGGGRRAEVNFPSSEEKKTLVSGKTKCFRRYFRLQVLPDGTVFSPCPPADPADAGCDRPCNCAGFLDRVLAVKEGETVEEPKLRGRLSPEEAETLAAFVKAYINPRLRGTEYRLLVRGAGGPPAPASPA